MQRHTASTSEKSFAAGALCVLVLLGMVGGTPARGAIWGIETSGSDGEPRSTLFHLAENGSAFNAVGPVRMGGQNIEADGLAMSPQADLYGFHIAAGASSLVRISKTTAGAYSPGPQLSGVEVRGAVFCVSGKLTALDAAGDRLVFVDPASGAIVGSPVSLWLDGSAFDVPSCSDIAQRQDGLMMISGGDGNALYSVDVLTGELTPLITDTEPGSDAALVCLTGLAFTRSSSLFNTLFAYDASADDDVFAYEVDEGFQRTLLFPNILSTYEGSRGDLAAQLDPPESYRIRNRVATDPVTRRGSFLHRYILWGRVQDLSEDGFTLDDGSGAPVRVSVSGHSGLTNGDYAEAGGVLQYPVDGGAILLCAREDISVLADGSGGE